MNQAQRFVVQRSGFWVGYRERPTEPQSFITFIIHHL